MVKLRDGEVVAFPPFAPAVVGIPHPAVITGKDSLRIGWIDPDTMNVPMHPTANRGEAFPGILTDNHCAVGLKKAVGIFWINNQIGEVKRTPHHPPALIALIPGAAAIVGDKERAIG